MHKRETFHLSKGLGGALIVGGTAIGAGMLALPVVTAPGGFLPACFLYFLFWLYSVATGLLFLELCIWMPRGANIVSMARELLGPIGKYLAWGLYIFLFYSLTIAYVSGGGNFVRAVFGYWVPNEIAIALFTGVFAVFVYIGAQAVNKLNVLLMIGLVASYAAFLAIGIGHVSLEKLQVFHWGRAVFALPVLFTSFSYQGTVPTLYMYLERNTRLVRFAIIVGATIPFIVYVLWEFLILGIIPLEGEYGLLNTKAIQETAVSPLRYFFPHSPIYLIGEFFSAFALTTSFLGVTLGLLDFLADGLNIEKTRIKKLWLCVFIFVPSVIIACINPHIFLSALGYAGSYGCALLLGLLPITMVWVGRYSRHRAVGEPQLLGGKPMLIFLSAFVALGLFVQYLNTMQ